ncbi:MAG: DNA-binding response regulator [Deltaproteobacteria bacterium]|nr:MAG: DNA-binding response regulator [Deltaproteobacteria bacterium]
MNCYEIVLADDHPIFREGIKRVVERVPDLKVVGEAGDGLELMQLLQRISAQLLILDLSMPNRGGLDIINEIREINPQLKILILTMHKSRGYLYRAFSMKVQGYMIKEEAYANLIAAITTIRQGGTHISAFMGEQFADLVAKHCRRELHFEIDRLSDRETQVLALLAEGKTDKEIADLLFIGVRTVNSHRRNIKNKLNINKGTELVSYAVRNGYI